MFDFVVMNTVSGAVPPVGAPAVIAPFQVEAHRVIGTGVPPCLAFIDIYARLPISREQAVVVVAIPTLAVVPPGQVDTDGFVITLHETMKTLINVCLTHLPCEA